MRSATANRSQEGRTVLKGVKKHAGPPVINRLDAEAMRMSFCSTAIAAPNFWTMLDHHPASYGHLNDPTRPEH